MDLELGHHSSVDFHNPNFVKYAEAFGAKGYRIRGAAELLPTLKSAFEDNAISVITCPVDYSENMELTDKLGRLTEASLEVGRYLLAHRNVSRRATTSIFVIWKSKHEDTQTIISL